MKKILFLSTIFFLSFSVIGQTSVKRLNLKEINTQIQKSQTVSDNSYLETDTPSIREFNSSYKQIQNNSLKYSLENDKQLDSIITEKWNDASSQWKTVAKVEYTYNEKGFLQKQIEYNLNVESKEWIASFKKEYDYDTSGNIILDFNYNWDSDSNLWINKSKWIYRYDSNGNRELKEVYSWSGTDKEWIGFYITESSYDNTGKLISNWDSNTWDRVSKEWNNQKKNEYEYSAIGNSTTSNYFERDNNLSDWLLKKRSEYLYDQSNNLVQIKEYSKSTNTDDWLFSGNTEYSYDTHGNMLTFIDLYWDSINEKWLTTNDIEYSWDNNNLIQNTYYVTNSAGRILSTINDYLYDTQGRQTYNRYRHWRWDYNLNLNQLYYETVYIDGFNNEGQKIVDSVKKWNYDSNKWSGDKSELSYDTNGNKDLSINYIWNSSLEQWGLYDRDTYYYSNRVINSVSEPIFANKIKIYPNPARDFVFFDVDSHSAFVELFDTQGKKLLTQKLLGTKLDVSHLKSGIYFYKLIQAEEIQSGKIIIK